jgi:hypothetical protein
MVVRRELLFVYSRAESYTLVKRVTGYDVGDVEIRGFKTHAKGDRFRNERELH